MRAIKPIDNTGSLWEYVLRNGYQICIDKIPKKTEEAFIVFSDLNCYNAGIISIKIFEHKGGQER